ncbi:MAG TPA: hypothetical protein VHV55_23495 [Pirellulales bacterium]|jgi:phosphomannomutase|nr:hypothetical protein [Pirellulales bacterium]
MSETFLCPGESQPVGRAIHLARLASYYAACRTCQHRHETGLLSLAVRRRLEQCESLPPRGPEFHAEGVQGVYHNQLTVAAMRRLAAAFGLVLRERLAELHPAPRDPVVVLAGDGRPITPEFLAAAAEGLRYCGCHVRETSSATSAMLAFAQQQQRADGGLLLGNPADRSHLVGVKFWGPGALPWSQGPELSAIEHLHQAPINRPTRTSGTASRVAIEADYLAGLEGYFHALRPLRFVLDTTSSTLRRLLRQLIARVACEIIEDDAEPGRPGEPSRAVSQSSAIRAPGAARLAAPTARRLGRRTLGAGADFGLWIDGDGEAAVIVDERGREVPPERLLPVLARHLQSEQPGAAIVIEPSSTQPASDELLGVIDHASLATDATRRGMAAAMAGTQAVLGGGPSGRYWLPPSPAPDALHLVALLLTLLSRRDWPLSEVIARSLEPAGSYL